MIAILAGFLLVGYLLAPGAIYRLFFSFGVSSRRFQRSRTEEVVFSVLVTLLPFALSCFLLLATPLGRHPALAGMGKHEAYRTVLNSVLPAGNGDLSHDMVAHAYLRAFAEQARFLVWLWLLTALEGWCASRIILRYGDLLETSFLRRLCDRTLLSHVSEWELLLTTFTQPSTERSLRVELDALTSLGILYRGQLDDWFVDTDGKLAGIYLVNAFRYNKDALDADRQAGREQPSETYWRPIAGARLYLVGSTVANYNIRYVQPTEDELLGQSIVITPLPGENTEI